MFPADRPHAFQTFTGMQVSNTSCLFTAWGCELPTARSTWKATPLRRALGVLFSGLQRPPGFVTPV